MRQGHENASVHRARLGVAMVLLTVLTAACDWTTLGFDAAHTRGTADPGPALDHPALVDHVGTDLVGSGVVSSAPIVDANTLFAITDTGELDAFPATVTATSPGCDSETRCRPTWTATSGPSSGSSPTVDHGLVVTSSADGVVRAFDAAGVRSCGGEPRRCTPVWRTAPVGPLESSPLIVGGVLYVGSTDGNLYAYDAGGATNCADDMCTPLFHAAVGSPIRSSPIAFGTDVIVGTDDGTVASYDPTGWSRCIDGCAPRWTAHEGAPVRDALAVYGTTLLVGSATGTLDAYDAAGTTGCTAFPAECSPLWSAPTGSPIHAAVAVRAGTVVVGTDDGTVRAYDVTGHSGCTATPSVCEPRWSTAAATSPIHGAPVIAVGHVFAGWADGRVAAFDLLGADGCSGTPVTCAPVWTADVGHDPGPPTVSHRRLFVGAGDVHTFRTVATTTARDLAVQTLTDDGDDGIAFDETPTGDVLVQARSTNTGGNLRATFARLDEPASTDQSSCATWSGDSGRLNQEGASLRVHDVAGGTKAITITKNVWFAANWIFNVHVWDTSTSPVGTVIAGFDLRSVFYPDGAYTAYPWSICARVVGDVVSFVAWPTGSPRPEWDDPTHGGSVSLPPGFGAAGRPGWYIGHLHAGDHAEFRDLSAGPIDAPPAGGPASGRPPVRKPRDVPSLP